MNQKTWKPFTKHDLKKAEVKLLRNGRWGNACVSVATINGEQWTIKDFSSRHWLVRNTFGKFVLGRELRALERISGIKGVPGKAFMLDEHTLAIEFIPGRSLSQVPKEEVSSEYLKGCEEIISSIHKRGIVHLDTRGTGNWVMKEDGTPGLIDFQAGVYTKNLPLKLRSFMEDMDLGGVYKKWKNYRPDEMGDFRASENERISKLRNLWIIKGYFGVKKKHK